MNRSLWGKASESINRFKTHTEHQFTYGFKGSGWSLERLGRSGWYVDTARPQEWLPEANWGGLLRGSGLLVNRGAEGLEFGWEGLQSDGIVVEFHPSGFTSGYG
jgi:hypothetical protein